MTKGTVHSISIGAERGQLKKEVPEAVVIANHGIEGYGHVLQVAYAAATTMALLTKVDEKELRVLYIPECTGLNVLL